MTDDRNTAPKRIRRTARVAGTMGGLAVKLAGEKFLGLKIDRADHALDLKNALGNLRGPLMKIAQLLATIPDALPAEYTAELQQLQSQAPPMGWPFVKRRMATELGADWQNKFTEFPRTAAAAASLGQVHKALTTAGQTVACKLQYPDMAAAVDSDLQQLKLILSIYEAADKAIQTKYILQEVSERLREELDYAREAKQCRLYAHMLREEKHIHIPQIVDALCGPRLLTTTWLEGRSILEFKNAPLETRNRLALQLFRAWYVPLYHYGIIHGDPHMGNYTIDKNLDLNLLDFGCIRVFPAKFIQGIIDLYHALQTDNRDLAVHAYEAWGFKNLSRELIDTLTIWAKFLYSAVLDDRVRTIGKSQGTVYGRDTAMQVHAQLRQQGGVTVPREFVFMDRAALGLGSVFIHLQAEINWHDLFQELIADFSSKRLESNQKAALKKVGLTA